MINRVLIRIKVVQMLYSYLLTRSDFRIQAEPLSASRDNRFAYTQYIDTLLLILALSGIRLPDSPLSGKTLPRLKDTRLARALATDPTISDQFSQAARRLSPYVGCIDAIVARITESDAFKTYRRIKQPTLQDDATLWIGIVRNILLTDKGFLEAARTNEGYTHVGFERGLESVCSTLESCSDSGTSYLEAGNTLQRSLDKAYELYASLLVLAIRLTDLQERRIDDAKHKYLPTQDELNPDTRFIDNAFVSALRNNPSLNSYTEDHPLSLTDDDLLLDSLLDRILASDIYRRYMDAETSDFAADCELWRQLYKNIILPGDDLAEALENQSIYWNDDLHIMGTFVIKSLKRMAAAGSAAPEVQLLDKYKDDEDRRFGPELFRYAVDNREEYRALIDRFLNSGSWEPDRLAFMDAVIMIAAIAELTHFPSIPVPVTMNEYVEIANYYSTPKSGQFINGILFSVMNELKEQGKLLK